MSAHCCVAEHAAQIGFGRYIISATSPLLNKDLLQLNQDAPAVVAHRVPEYADVYRKHGWQMFDRIGRVYVNSKVREELCWTPQVDFSSVLASLSTNGAIPSSDAFRFADLKGYHNEELEVDGPYPT